jgi:hypothetical protein
MSQPLSLLSRPPSRSEPVYFSVKKWSARTTQRNQNSPIATTTPLPNRLFKSESQVLCVLSPKVDCIYQEGLIEILKPRQAPPRSSPFHGPSIGGEADRGRSPHGGEGSGALSLHDVRSKIRFTDVGLCPVTAPMDRSVAPSLRIACMRSITAISA